MKVSWKMSSNSLLAIICEAYEDDPRGLGEDIKIYADQGYSLLQIVEEILGTIEEDVAA